MAGQIQMPINLPVENGEKELSARATKNDYEQVQQVTWNTVCHVVDFIFNWSANFKSVLCCGSCKKPHIFSRQAVNILQNRQLLDNW